MRISQTPTLFAEFLRELNTTVAQNKSNQTAQAFIAAAENAADASGTFDVAVYAESPQIPVDHFTVRLREGQFHLVKRGRSGIGTAVELPICQLDALVNPEK